MNNLNSNKKIPYGTAVAAMAFNLAGTGKLIGSEELLALGAMTVEDCAAAAEYRGIRTTVPDKEVDDKVKIYMQSLCFCRNADDVVTYFDVLDQILTDKDGCYHANWLPVIQHWILVQLMISILSRGATHLPQHFLVELVNYVCSVK